MFQVSTPIFFWASAGSVSAMTTSAVVKAAASRICRHLMSSLLYQPTSALPRLLSKFVERRSSSLRPSSTMLWLADTSHQVVLVPDPTALSLASSFQLLLRVCRRDRHAGAPGQCREDAAKEDDHPRHHGLHRRHDNIRWRSCDRDRTGPRNHLGTTHFTLPGEWMAVTYPG